MRCVTGQRGASRVKRKRRAPMMGHCDRSRSGLKECATLIPIELTVVLSPSPLRAQNRPAARRLRAVNLLRASCSRGGPYGSPRCVAPAAASWSSWGSDCSWLWSRRAQEGPSWCSRAWHWQRRRRRRSTARVHSGPGVEPCDATEQQVGRPVSLLCRDGGQVRCPGSFRAEPPVVWREPARGGADGGNQGGI